MVQDDGGWAGPAVTVDPPPGRNTLDPCADTLETIHVRWDDGRELGLVSECDH